MTDLMRPVLDRLGDLQRATSGMVNLRWATVTQSSPLRVRFDAEADPMGLTPATLVGPLIPGERVLVASQHNRHTVLMVAGRTMNLRGTTAERDALGLTGVVQSGQTFFDEDEDVEYTWLGSAWQVTLPIHGKIAIAPASGGARVIVSVTFPSGSFANIPMVSCNAIANAPTSTSTDLYVQPSNITSSGFDINFMRSTSTTTTIGWTATPDHAGVL